MQTTRRRSQGKERVRWSAVLSCLAWNLHNKIDHRENSHLLLSSSALSHAHSPAHSNPSFCASTHSSTVHNDRRTQRTTPESAICTPSKYDYVHTPSLAEPNWRISLACVKPVFPVFRRSRNMRKCTPSPPDHLCHCSCRCGRGAV